MTNIAKELDPLAVFTSYQKNLWDFQTNGNFKWFQTETIAYIFIFIVYLWSIEDNLIIYL